MIFFCLQINPQHCVPTIVDDGFALWESRAIITYLVNKYAPGHDLYPTDVKKRAHVDRALYFDGCGLYPSFGAVVYPIVRDGAQFNPQSAQPLYQKLEVLDQLLSTQEYVAGDQLTVGDLSTVATYTAIRSVSFLETSKYTNIQKWVERVAPQVKNWELVGVEQAKKFGEFIENFLKANAAKSE